MAEPTAAGQGPAADFAVVTGREAPVPSLAGALPVTCSYDENAIAPGRQRLGDDLRRAHVIPWEPGSVETNIVAAGPRRADCQVIGQDSPFLAGPGVVRVPPVDGTIRYLQGAGDQDVGP